MTLLLSLFLACSGDSDSTFSSAGNTTVDPDSLTGSTEGGSDGGSSSDGGVNPVISGMDGAFVELDDGMAIEMHIYVDDAQDDLLNGTLEVDYQWDDSSESAELTIDGETVLVEEGELTFFISDVDETATYEVFVTVYDEASNPSDQASTEVLPAE